MVEAIAYRTNAGELLCRSCARKSTNQLRSTLKPFDERYLISHRLFDPLCDCCGEKVLEDYYFPEA